MSGHSKWSTIKRKKGVADAARGKLFTKLALTITTAVRSGGADLSANAALRAAVDKARAANVPKDSIAKAIAKGSGAASGVGLISFSYDAVGPGGAAIIMEGATDNKNRTLSEIKLLLSRHQAKMAETGSQRWQFDKRGVINVLLAGLTAEQKNQAQLDLIESGAEDLVVDDKMIKVVTAPGQLKKIGDMVEQAGYSIMSRSIEYIAKNKITLGAADKEKTELLINKLRDQQDTKLIVSNLA